MDYWAWSIYISRTQALSIYFSLSAVFCLSIFSRTLSLSFCFFLRTISLSLSFSLSFCLSFSLFLCVCTDQRSLVHVFSLTHTHLRNHSCPSVQLSKESLVLYRTWSLDSFVQVCGISIMYEHTLIYVYTRSIICFYTQMSMYNTPCTCVYLYTCMYVHTYMYTHM